MSNRAYSEINLHVVWRVKHDVPVLQGHVEKQLHCFIRAKVMQEPGVLWHDIGGTDDHVHLVVSIPPTLLMSDWIGRLKGASAYFINHRIANRKVLEWQPGYGVVTFGKNNMKWILAYVRGQRRHHARGTVHPRLERTEPDEDDKPAEAGSKS